jgi:hypothetical protein
MRPDGGTSLPGPGTIDVSSTQMAFTGDKSGRTRVSAYSSRGRWLGACLRPGQEARQVQSRRVSGRMRPATGARR